MRRNKTAGFTIVELAVTIAVIGILAAGTVWVSRSIYATGDSARDSERASDTQSIAILFEQHYRSTPDASGPSYPTTTEISTSLDTIISNQELVTPPKANEPALISATSKDSQSPTIDQYIYQPLTIDGAICSTRPCVKFTLYYRTELNDEVKTLESRHQQ